MRDIIIKTGKRKTTVSKAAIRKAVHEAYDKLRKGELQPVDINTLSPRKVNAES